jgi:copper chaperone
MTQVILDVPNIECEHCEATVTRALTPLAGVHSVRVDIPAHLVTLDYDERLLNLDKVKDALQEEDYPVEQVLAGGRVLL